MATPVKTVAKKADGTIMTINPLKCPFRGKEVGDQSFAQWMRFFECSASATQKCEHQLPMKQEKGALTCVIEVKKSFRKTKTDRR